MPEAVAAPAPVAAAAVIQPGQAATPEVVPPAVSTPKPTIPSPDKILANIKAKIAEANKPPEPAKTEPAKQPGDILPDAKQALAELAKAQAKAREWQERAKALEAASADAELGKTIKGAKTPKDQLEAIAKLAGKDPVEYMADLVTMMYAEGAAPAQADKPQPTGDMKVIMDQLAAVSKELAEIKAGKTQETEASKAAAAAQQEAGTKAYLRAIAEKHKDKFEISSRPENVDEAVAKAQAAAPAVLVEMATELGVEPADLAKSLTQEQADDLAARAMAKAEAEFEQLGKRFAKAGPPPRPPRAYELPLTKPALVLQGKPEPLKKGTEAEWEQYKAKMRERYTANASQHFGTGKTYQSADDSRQAGITR
jgi:hypothetical protein